MQVSAFVGFCVASHSSEPPYWVVSGKKPGGVSADSTTPEARVRDIKVFRLGYEEIKPVTYWGVASVNNSYRFRDVG